MRCERKDGTFYGTDGQCRIGVEVGPREREWVEKQAKQWPSARKALEELGKAVAGLPDNEREIFNSQISKYLNADNLKHNWVNLKGERISPGEERLPYSDEKKLESLNKQIKGWKEMISLGYPTKLQLRDGTFTEAPSGMLPVVMQASGQKKYVREGDNRVFNIKAGGIATQNRAGKEDTNRYVPAATTFKKEQESKGGKWPTQTLPPRTDIELDPVKIIANLTLAEKRNIATNGLPKKGNANQPGAVLLEFYARPENRHLLEQRVREIVDRYVEQGGRSGVTGLPIAIPGLKADPAKGEGKATVDHFNPISGGKGMTPLEIIKQFDNKRNFLLAEEGPNTNRSNIPWDDWLERENKSGKKKPQQQQAKIIQVPSQKPSPVNDQKAQISKIQQKLAKLESDGLSRAKALSKLTTSEMALYAAFL
jgi:hypothetical protein